MSPAVANPRKVGLIVNPIAGMGGRVGLKGTDGAERLRRARELGAVPLAPLRAGLALNRLLPLSAEFTLLAAPGQMGEDEARAQGIDPVVIAAGPDADGETGRDHTLEAAREMAERDADLILFAGGDGTARLILEAAGSELPVVGIPTGVKMHSGCFARNPGLAGDVAAEFVMAPPGETPLDDADVVDRVELEDGTMDGQRHFGSLRVPRASNRVLAAKSQSSARGAAAVEGACREIVESMRPEAVYVLGPGSTTGRIRSLLGIESGPLAVDVIQNRKLIAGDVSEADLIGLVVTESDVELIVGVIGGQGSLLGRGNQQISAEVLRHIDADRMMVVAGLDKLISLGSAPLSVDTGDPEVDRKFAGHRPVRIGRKESLICEVAA